MTNIFGGKNKKGGFIFGNDSRQGDIVFGTKKSNPQPSHRPTLGGRPAVGGRGNQKPVKPAGPSETVTPSPSRMSRLFSWCLSLSLSATIFMACLAMIGFYVVPENVEGPYGETYKIFGKSINSSGYKFDVRKDVVNVHNEVLDYDVGYNIDKNYKFHSFSFPTALVSSAYKDLKYLPVTLDPAMLQAEPYFIKDGVAYHKVNVQRDMDYREAISALMLNNKVDANIMINTINSLVIFRDYGLRDLFDTYRERGDSHNATSLEKTVQNINQEMESSLPMQLLSNFSYGPAAMMKLFEGSTKQNFYFEQLQKNRQTVLRQGDVIIVGANGISVTLYFQNGR
ncbi:MAG: hypothetical protein RSG77_19485 [Hafnia sp.]